MWRSELLFFVFALGLCGCGQPVQDSANVQSAGGGSVLDPVVEVEVRSGLIEKYLELYKIIVRFPPYGPKILLLRTPVPEDYRLDERWVQVSNADKYYHVPWISAFLEASNIPVGNGADAVEVTMLVEELLLAADMLEQGGARDGKIQIYDDRGRRKLARGRDWRYSAKKNGSVWTVSINYIGPPGKVLAPPRYEIVVDPWTDLFVEIRML